MRKKRRKEKVGDIIKITKTHCKGCILKLAKPIEYTQKYTLLYLERLLPYEKGQCSEGHIDCCLAFTEPDCFIPYSPTDEEIPKILVYKLVSRKDQALLSYGKINPEIFLEEE